MTRRFLLVGALVAAAVALAAPARAITPRIAPSTPTFTVTEGDTHVVQFSLDEPIIAMEVDPTVTITFNVSDPSRVSLSTNSLTWAATEWSQTRSVTATAIHDNVANGSPDVSVGYVATSESEYYNGFAGSFTATITDLDATTTTTAPRTTTTLAPVSSTTSAAATPTTSVATLPATATSSVAPAATTLPATGGGDSNGLGVAAAMIIATGALVLSVTRRRTRHC